MTRSQLLLIFYLVLSIVEITGDILGNQILVFATKPLLMPTLLIWFLIETKGSSKFKNIIAGSIVAAFFGDTFLMLLPYNEIFFLLGLGSFLIGQVLYGYGFILNIKNSNSQSNKMVNLSVSILFAVFYTSLMTLLYPSLSKVEEGAFLIPVLIYGLAICFMGLTAAFRFKKVVLSSFQYSFIGALTFVVSDTCIALDKFHFPGGFPYAQAVIMITYCTAQYLLVKGSILHIQNKDAQ
ncbi:MAG: lysoplasmalogenase [Flavobacteriales bacterium]|nr:lysoplasmalogenase [Flavobacteriales bacterium]